MRSLSCAFHRRAGNACAEIRVVQVLKNGNGLPVPGLAANFASREACANLFQGQMARQSSQPNTRLPRPAKGAGNMPFVLDREVRKAAARIEALVGRGEGAG